jgi:hypothetical protein
MIKPLPNPKPVILSWGSQEGVILRWGKLEKGFKSAKKQLISTFLCRY